MESSSIFAVAVASRPGAPPTRKRGKLACQPTGPVGPIDNSTRPFASIPCGTGHPVTERIRMNGKVTLETRLRLTSPLPLRNNNNNNNNNHDDIYNAVIYGASHMREFTVVHLGQIRSAPGGRQLVGQAANLTFESACIGCYRPNIRPSPCIITQP